MFFRKSSKLSVATSWPCPGWPGRGSPHACTARRMRWHCATTAIKAEVPQSALAVPGRSYTDHAVRPGPYRPSTFRRILDAPHRSVGENFPRVPLIPHLSAREQDSHFGMHGRPIPDQNHRFRPSVTMLSDALSSDAACEVVGTASDGRIASPQCLRTRIGSPRKIQTGEEPATTQSGSIAFPDDATPPLAICCVFLSGAAMSLVRLARPSPFQTMDSTVFPVLRHPSR
jgi:hypothetical protein